MAVWRVNEKMVKEDKKKKKKKKASCECEDEGRSQSFLQALDFG